MLDLSACGSPVHHSIGLTVGGVHEGVVSKEGAHSGSTLMQGYIREGVLYFLQLHKLAFSESARGREREREREREDTIVYVIKHVTGLARQGTQKKPRACCCGCLSSRCSRGSPSSSYHLGGGDVFVSSQGCVVARFLPTRMVCSRSCVAKALSCRASVVV